MLRIAADKPFAEIQEAFHKAYPFLKLERLPAAAANKERKSVTDTGVKTLKKFSNSNHWITITDNTTVAELVNQFSQKKNIRVRVLRSANNLWIETSLTESWTLEKQNAASRQLNEF